MKKKHFAWGNFTIDIQTKLELHKILGQNSVFINTH